MNKILVVDDDINILKVIKLRLEADGYEVDTAMQAKQALKQAEDASYDMALVDLKLGKTDGIALMEALHQLSPALPVIILTAHGSIDSAVDAMKKGATSYITKPFDYQELHGKIKDCLEKNELSREIDRLRNLIGQRYGFDNIIGRSEKMQRVLEKVALAAQSDSTVYIEGESGTGKELIAKALHVAGPRKDKRFVAVNCAAIPETLLESELFGYEKGAFTGAVGSKQGLFARAQDGTFFMDEISEMPLSMQPKLLRVIQEKEVLPVGSTLPFKLNVRLIASSNRNLEEAVRKGLFREDLFYRIHVIVIHLPPLRERKEDIPLLCDFFLKKFTGNGPKKIKGMSPSALQKMIQYDWPGNVRELENSIESAVAMTTREVITEEFMLQSRNIKPSEIQPYKMAKANFEKNYLLQLIEKAEGNMSRAAEISGKFRADLYELFKKHNLTPADYRRS
ncbi:MAG: sigma-54 dependent transcriptional regulator [Desulfobacterales bacterium]|jgi:two-component system response regulator GlrR|nr:sigma-54 dependent transcriptional regulator [Desulfobacterales bacterium]